jgi:hypothetical protein
MGRRTIGDILSETEGFRPRSWEFFDMAGGPMGIVSFLFLSLEVITTTMKQQT